MKKVLLIIVSLALIISCKKNITTEDEQKVEIPDAAKTTTRHTIYNPANVNVQAGYEDANGNLVPFTQNNPGLTEDDFPGCGDRAYLINFAYKGYSVLYNGGTNTYAVSFSWELKIPQGETTPMLSTVNRGWFRFTNPFPGPTTWQSTPATFYLTGTEVIYDNGSPVTREIYGLSYTFNFSSTAYCGNLNFNTYVRIASDCSEFPIMQMVGNPSYIVDDLEPDTYNVYTYGAIGQSGSIQFFPLIVVPQPCHLPSLGNSPTHWVRYRIYGSNIWIPDLYGVQRNDLLDFSLNVSPGGVYEYQSQGLILPGVKSPWSNSQYVTVY
ncbi:MAG TPA: hypothetical protein PKA77_11680 [Chitinophagaceae bacterium]|nr:hypothetical protein [Chitinophagaceae bacterium]HMU58417.1 hypothetical protein [Chitinophagaceae bacterium]